jgi:hypothetical protein
MGYRGVSLSTANAVRCADLLERCAVEGRVTEGAAGVRVSGVEIAPDFDLEEGRAVAMVFPGGGDDINMRILVTPRQASLAAGWLRIAIAPGETLQQARSNARIAAERKRAARCGPS